MSQVSGYPKAAFGPNAWLLGYSNSNSQTTLFTAQSVIDFFNLDEINEELLVRVRSFTTNQLAITEDMPLNTILYTAGNTAVGDGGGGSWIVVESGGSINMNNGYQMKLIPVGDLTGSDVTLTVVNTDTGSSQTLQAALNDRKAIGQTTVSISGSTGAVLTAEQVAAETLVFNGATTADISVSTPTNTAQTWVVVNNDTGGNTLTFKTATGTGVDLLGGGRQYLIRSDGTNMVLVATLEPQFGVDQSWQTFTVGVDRSVGVEYTNDDVVPRFVAVTVNWTSATLFTVIATVDGSTLARADNAGSTGNFRDCLIFPVAPGSTYEITLGDAAIQTWKEFTVVGL